MKENNNLSKYIGVKIRGIRQGKDLTQVELADLVGTKQSSISQLENGRRLPSLSFLQKVGHSLGIEVGVVMEERVVH